MKWLTYVILDRRREPRPEWCEVGLAGVGNEDREQRLGVDEQHALAAVDPEQVPVPVVLARWDAGKSRGSHP